jgi:cation-transporting ATPase 13A3/4/5
MVELGRQLGINSALCMRIQVIRAEYPPQVHRYSLFAPLFLWCRHSFFVTAAGIYSIGGHFRKPVYTNWRLTSIVLSLLALVGVLLLTPTPNTMTALFHIASNNFNGEGTTVAVWQRYQAEGGEPTAPMSPELRLRLALLVIGGITSCVVWETFVVQGLVRSWIYHRHGDHKRKAAIPL